MTNDPQSCRTIVIFNGWTSLVPSVGKAALADDEDTGAHFQLLRAYQLTGQTDLARQALVDYQRAREGSGQAKRMTEAGGITAP